MTVAGVAAVFVAAATVYTEGWARFFGGARSENRFALYALRNQVSPGMPAAQLRGVIATDASGKIEHRWLSGTAVSAWTHLSFWRTATLSIELRDGKVVHAVIRDDEGGRFEDAPADF
jgi:hypothetical protein